MLYPTIEELTKGQYNRYELALATANCARLITDEYVRQHESVEKAATGNKEADRALTATVDRELRDEKAVKVAINRIHRGEYCIDENAKEKAAAAAPAPVEPERIDMDLLRAMADEDDEDDEDLGDLPEDDELLAEDDE